MLSRAQNVIIPTNLCSLLIYTPSSVRHQPRRNRCVYRINCASGFILTVNLNVTDDRPRQFLAFFNENDVVPTPQIPCVFQGKMRLAFNVTVNSYDTRPTAPGFLIFFQLKRASRKPLQIPCVFSMKSVSCVQGECKFICDAVVASTFFVFFEENAPRRNPAAFVGFTFLVFSEVIRVLRSEVIVNLHVMRPTAP